MSSGPATKLAFNDEWVLAEKGANSHILGRVVEAQFALFREVDGTIQRMPPDATEDERKTYPLRVLDIVPGQSVRLNPAYEYSIGAVTTGNGQTGLAPQVLPYALLGYSVDVVVTLANFVRIGDMNEGDRLLLREHVAHAEKIKTDLRAQRAGLVAPKVRSVG